LICAGRHPRRLFFCCLGFLADKKEERESAALAESVASSDGVVFVPALTGLGAPYWDPDARGLVCGITPATRPAHLVRAALEGIAHQVADVVAALPGELSVLRADGGATANGFLMQRQADLLGCPVEVAAEPESTALGVAALAGLAIGAWRGPDELAPLIGRGARYEPALDPRQASAERAAWSAAVRRARLV